MIGHAALAIWFDVDPAGEDDVNCWYPRQHLPERLSVPGFLRGRRYEATHRGPRYFTLYETADAAVLASPAYIERLNDPTQWTRLALSSFRGMMRGVYRMLATRGDTCERHVFTARVTPTPGREPALRDWLAGEAPTALGSIPGVTGFGLYETESQMPSVVTEERRIVGEHGFAATPFVAIVEVGDASREGMLREFWDSRAGSLGARVEGDLYRLLYGLAWIAPR
jgi:hypothetical protein